MGISARSRILTPRMRGTLVVTAVVVVLGLGVGAWLLVAPVAPGEKPVAAQTSGPVPGATPTTGSEVQTPKESTAPNDRLPPREGAAPRVSLPLPTPASAQGAVVEGYPADLAPPVDGSDVLDTSLATENEVLQFTLVARSDASGEDILAHYGALWAGLGLTPTSVAEAGAASYTDAFSSVTVSADASGTGTVYTIFGVLRAG